MQLAYRSPYDPAIFSINGTKGMVEEWNISPAVIMSMSAWEKVPVKEYEVETYANASMSLKFAHVVDCIQKGLTENPIMTHEKNHPNHGANGCLCARVGA